MITAVIGEMLGTRRLLSELGTGGMGTVYLAEDGEGARVALKVVHPHLLLTPRHRERFLREAELGLRIRHPNVVATFGVESMSAQGRETLAISMEYVEGQTLRSLLDELGRVPEELCRHIAIEVAKALEAMHADGVVHRDLKPENVLVTRDHVVKVMDLGVASLLGERSGLSQTGSFVGSVLYAAPELFRAEQPDGRSDLYALGLVLYELSTGRHPFPGDDIATVIQRHLGEEPRAPALLNPQLSPLFEECVKALLAKEREGRFASARLLRDVLEEGERSLWWQQRARAIRTGTRQPLRRIRIPRETALHGRDDELATLRRLWAQAKAGQAQVVLIEGEAGIGKTRLVDEFVAKLRDEGEEVNFLFGSYPPGGAATAASAFVTACLEQFGADGLEATLGRYLAVTPGLIPAFAALLGGEATPKGEQPLTQDSLQAVFVHALRALAAERPTVLLVEDLHFAPQGGRALFAALALGLPQHRVLLVGTTRPGLPGDWVAEMDYLPHVSRLPLARLGPKDLARLLMDAFGSERLARELAYAIGAKSDGNPFFTFEIIRGLREGKFITQKRDGTWVKTQMIEQIELPDTVKELIQARMADLDPEEQNLLDVAACCGYEFDPRLVGRVLGLGGIPALQRLARIERSHRLVRSAGAKYVFDHHQVQESLYEALAEPLREEYHQALAEALEGGAHRDEDEGAAAVELCRHFLRSACARRAAPYLTGALDHLERAYANEAVVDLAERALAVPGLLEGRPRLETLLRARARLDLLGHRGRERAMLDEAVAIADALGDAALRSRVHFEMGCHLFRGALYEEAGRRFADALELAGQAGDRPLYARVVGCLGGIAFDRGDYEQARLHHERHRALAAEIGDLRGEASASGNLGIALKNLGRLAEARSNLERHLALSRQTGDRRGEVIAMGNLGLVCTTLGLWEEARGHLTHCLGLAREMGFRHAEACVMGNLGSVLLCFGHASEALEQHENHRALSREIGDRRGEANATGNLGIAAMALGRYAEALEHIHAFMDLSRQIGDRRGDAIALETMGRLQLALGDPAAAHGAFTKSLELARLLGARGPEGSALHGLGMAAEQVGDLGGAARLYGEALALRRGIGERSGAAATLLALGRVEGARGRGDEAAARIGEAEELGRELGAPATLLLGAALAGRTDAALALLAAHADRVPLPERMEVSFLLWKATGDARHRAEAERLLGHLRDHAPEASRASLLRNVPLHREIARTESPRGACLARPQEWGPGRGLDAPCGPA